MKRTILLLIILNFQFTVLNCFSQPAIQWEKCLGGSGTDQAWSVCQTFDGGYIVAGQALSRDGNLDSSNHIGSAWLVKLDNDGIIQWQNSYGGSSNDDIVYSIIQTSDSGFIFTGQTGSTDGDLTNSGNHGGGDVWVCKLNDTGAIEWSKCYGGPGFDLAHSIVQTIDGGYILAGEAGSNGGDVSGFHGGLYDDWVVKLNDTGAIQWSKCYGGSNIDWAFSIIQTVDSGYIVAGVSNSTDGDVSAIYNGYNGDEWIIKLDTLGNIQWEKCYGGPNGSTAYSILQTLDGGYITGGNAFAEGGDIIGFHGGMSDYWVVRLTDTGNIQWAKCFGGSDDDEGHSIVKTVDGNYAIGGYSISTDYDVTGNHGLDDYWVVKLDTNGNMIWEQSYGGINSEDAYCMIATNDNGMAITGYANGSSDEVTGYHGGQFDYWVVKLNPDPITGIKEINSNEVVRVYPNPASNTITFSQSGIRNYELRITDVLGRVVYKTSLSRDNNSIAISDFSNGVYFYQLTNSKETVRGKFVKE